MMADGRYNSNLSHRYAQGACSLRPVDAFEAAFPWGRAISDYGLGSAVNQTGQFFGGPAPARAAR